MLMFTMKIATLFSTATGDIVEAATEISKQHYGLLIAADLELVSKK